VKDDACNRWTYTWVSITLIAFVASLLVAVAANHVDRIIALESRVSALEAQAAEPVQLDWSGLYDLNPEAGR